MFNAFTAKNCVTIRINGKTYFRGKDFEIVKVHTPTMQEPYWGFEFLLSEETVREILATGQVDVIFED